MVDISRSLKVTKIKLIKFHLPKVRECICVEISESLKDFVFFWLFCERILKKLNIKEYVGAKCTK